MEEINVTDNELLQALFEAMRQPGDDGLPPGYMTRKQLQERLHCSRSTIYRLFDLLEASGVELETIDMTTKNRAKRISKIPAYRIKRDGLEEDLHG